MSNVEIFDTTFAMTILVIMALPYNPSCGQLGLASG